MDIKKNPNLFEKLLSLVYPTHCLSCDKIIHYTAFFCDMCLLSLQPIKFPICFKCGNNKSLCECNHALFQKNFHATLSAFYFSGNKGVVPLIYSIKTDKNPEIVSMFAHTIIHRVVKSSEYTRCFSEVDYISSVPISKSTARKRGFNQSKLIAKAVAKLLGKPYVDTLIKQNDTASQHSLGQAERLKNLKNAFEINKKTAHIIKDKSILLIDDVYTTGTTLNECSKILVDADAKNVCVATVAKTIFYA